MLWYQILRNKDFDFSHQHCILKKSEAPLSSHSCITVYCDYRFVTMALLCETGKLYFVQRFREANKRLLQIALLCRDITCCGSANMIRRASEFSARVRSHKKNLPAWLPHNYTKLLEFIFQMNISYQNT